MRKNKKNSNLRISSFLYKYTVFVILVILLFTFSILSTSFLTFINLKNLLLQNTHIIVLVIGIAIIMIGGGIDLSVGYQISLVSVFIGMMFAAGLNSSIVILIGISVGALCGVFNGLLVTWFGIVPFAATLSSQIILRGVSYTLSKGSTFSKIPQAFWMISRGAFAGIQIDIWIAILCLAVFGFIFTHSFLGKHIRAVGENEEATKRAGVNVNLIKFISYVLGGAFFAISAIIMVSKQGLASSSTGPGLEFIGISAAFIGGLTSFQYGGRGNNIHIWNIIGGVFVLAIIDNGIQLIGGSQYMQYIITGIIIAALMAINKRSEKIFS